MRPRTRIPQRVVMYIYINSLLYIYYNIIHNVPGVFRKTNIVFQDTGSETTANREILEQLETEAVFFKVDRRVQRLPGRSSCNIKSNRWNGPVSYCSYANSPIRRLSEACCAYFGRCCLQSLAVLFLRMLVTVSGMKSTVTMSMSNVFFENKTVYSLKLLGNTMLPKLHTIFFVDVFWTLHLQVSHIRCI